MAPVAALQCGGQQVRRVRRQSHLQWRAVERPRRIQQTAGAPVEGAQLAAAGGHQHPAVGRERGVGHRLRMHQRRAGFAAVADRDHARHVAVHHGHVVAVEMQLLRRQRRRASCRHARPAPAPQVQPAVAGGAGEQAGAGRIGGGVAGQRPAQCQLRHRRPRGGDAFAQVGVGRVGQPPEQAVVRGEGGHGAVAGIGLQARGGDGAWRGQHAAGAAGRVPHVDMAAGGGQQPAPVAAEGQHLDGGRRRRPHLAHAQAGGVQQAHAAVGMAQRQQRATGLRRPAGRRLGRGEGMHQARAEAGGVQQLQAALVAAGDEACAVAQDPAAADGGHAPCRRACPPAVHREQACITLAVAQHRVAAAGVEGGVEQVGEHLLRRQQQAAVGGGVQAHVLVHVDHRHARAGRVQVQGTADAAGGDHVHQPRAALAQRAQAHAFQRHAGGVAVRQAFAQVTGQQGQGVGMAALDDQTPGRVAARAPGLPARGGRARLRPLPLHQRRARPTTSASTAARTRRPASVRAGSSGPGAGRR